MRPALVLPFLAAALAAQEPHPTRQAEPPPATGQSAPIFRVTVVSRAINAIRYPQSVTSRVDLRGTTLLPRATGEAKIESRTGSTRIETEFDNLSPATQFGPEYLTYVLWAITPEGRPVNLGEVVLDGDESELLATTPLQSFGLIVTAEPYFAVTQPSDVVVMENLVRPDTAGTIQQVEAKYELLPRGAYVFNRGAFHPVQFKDDDEMQLAEARNAVEIARAAGAERYAADSLARAVRELSTAEQYAQGRNNERAVETTARAATQAAEDARVITFRRLREEQMANERAAAEKARAEAAEQAALAEQARADREAAEQARQEAEGAAAVARAEREAAEQAREEALEQQRLAQQEASRARGAAQQADIERRQMRQRLQQQLNTVLETRETARGLVSNIGDVLFDFNKATLKPAARERLAKVAGILLAYPGLNVRLEGHTDNVGDPQYNVKLSQERADAVRAYLVQQGVSAALVTAVGLGEADPVAGNETAAGRQQNRRVELVVSGEAIGIPAPAGQ